MYIKFIKKHVVGIAKGEVRNIPESQAKEMLAGKYAEEIDEDEYNELKAEMFKVLVDDQARTDEVEAKRIEKRDEEAAARMVETNKTNIIGATNLKKETPTDERVFLTVSEGDMENNPDFVAKDLKVGDEILLDEDANPVRSSDDGAYYGREGKIVGKQKPSSEN
jgi:co-chaperonin GroES (HSP10)